MNSQEGQPAKPTGSPRSPFFENEAKLVGKTLGRYQLLAVLGSGAMAGVVLAFDTTLRRRVALKILRPPPEGVPPETWQEQFLREARAAARLVHPHIVQIFDIGQCDGFSFFALEYLRHGTLGDLVERSGPLHWTRVCELGAQAADALAYAHDSDLLHRDLKPANLMLTERGHVKLSDFGLVRFRSARDPFDLPYKIIGTPMFMAPEVADGIYSPQSDLFSLAGTVWYALTGKPPYDLRCAQDVERIGVSLHLPPLAQYCRNAPVALEPALRRALDADPTRRFQRADQLSERLRDVLATSRQIDSRLARPEAELVRVTAEDGGDLQRLASVAKHHGQLPGKTRRGRKPSTLRFAILGLLALMAVAAIVIIQVVGQPDKSHDRASSVNSQPNELPVPEEPEPAKTPEDSEDQESVDPEQAAGDQEGDS
ncbi:MAG: serine/threonine protein kinase [Phycisphaeraceae bacterium]|nr:serine/threonine protein kinase [Phycisphaeraceae bacterium]